MTRTAKSDRYIAAEAALEASGKTAAYYAHLRAVAAAAKAAGHVGPAVPLNPHS